MPFVSLFDAVCSGGGNLLPLSLGNCVHNRKYEHLKNQ
jgi:hypothetical protein